MASVSTGPYSGHWAAQQHRAHSAGSGHNSPPLPHAAAAMNSPPMSPGGRSSVSGVGCLTAVRLTAGAKCTRFVRRLLHAGHMDFEFAAWQMVYLLARPQQVYRNFMYRKRTKDQYARDDPAFLVLLSAALSLTSVLFALVLGLSFFGFIRFFLWVVFVDCIACGVLVASALWLVSNNCLRRVRAPDQDVEWGYCFDVHLNAFFPVLVLMHFVMPLLYPLVIGHEGFIPRLMGNSLWFVGATYYVYITFLGYTALPHLKNTHIFLYPITFLFILTVATITAGWNISHTLMQFYHYRVA